MPMFYTNDKEKYPADFRDLFVRSESVSSGLKPNKSKVRTFTILYEYILTTSGILPSIASIWIATTWPKPDLIKEVEQIRDIQVKRYPSKMIIMKMVEKTIMTSIMVTSHS